VIDLLGDLRDLAAHLAADVALDEVVDLVDPDQRADLLLQGFTVVPGLVDLVTGVGLAGKKDPASLVAGCELVLEGLAAHRRIARSDETGYIRARPERPGPGKSTPFA